MSISNPNSFVSYISRSLNYIKLQSIDLLSLKSLSRSVSKEKLLFSFQSTTDLKKWVVGSDMDIGGLSHCDWSLLKIAPIVPSSIDYTKKDHSLIGVDSSIAKTAASHVAHAGAPLDASKPNIRIPVKPKFTGLFAGIISTMVPEKSTLDRSGYAGLRSTELPPVLFHSPRHDLGFYRYLEIRCKGDQR